MESNFSSKRARSLLVLIVCLFSELSFAQDLPRANSAEDVGMSTEQLNRINDIVQGHIDAGAIQGAVTGALGTRSWSDPAAELTAVIMMQQPVLTVVSDF